jgi:hypothetical protein
MRLRQGGTLGENALHSKEVGHQVVGVMLLPASVEVCVAANARA